MKILSFGSLNIDYTYDVDHFVTKGETLSSSSMQVFAGGKGLNQSIALARAGARVYHAGAIGNEGLFLLKMLKDNHVDVSNVSILEGVSTGHAIIQKDLSGDNCIMLYGGANQCIDHAKIHQVIDQFEKGDYLVLQNEISGLEEIVNYAHAKGMVIVLNPSPMNEKILALDLDKIDYMILNEIEAAQVLNLPKDNGEKLGKLLHEKFPQMKIVLTLGENGSVYTDATETVKQQAYKVSAVDTTAAGDTYTGYFLAGITMGMSVKASMALAAKASAITVSRAGASPSIPAMAEIENMEEF